MMPGVMLVTARHACCGHHYLCVEERLAPSVRMGSVTG